MTSDDSDSRSTEGGRDTTTTTESFVESMTFARNTASKRRLPHELSSSGGCWGCDECGTKGASVIPNSIQQAIDQYKRFKPTIKRTQERQLLVHQSVPARVSSDAVDATKATQTTLFSIWKWTLPLNSEPLLEYGTNHRIILVDRMASQGSSLQHIGTGIVGSGMETQGRHRLDTWKAGTAHLIPSRHDGTAVGWVHELAWDSSTSANGNGPVVLYMIKIPPAALESTILLEGSKVDDDYDDSGFSWCETVRKICQRTIAKDKTAFPSSFEEGLPLNAKEYQELKELCVSFEESDERK